MAFDTFDEGITPGGIRSKNEIRILICYLLNSVNEPLDKEVIVSSIQKQGLANYFETTSCISDLELHGNIICTDKEKESFSLTENGKMIASSLETVLPFSVKEKAYLCATQLLSQRKTETNNNCEIKKAENGYVVVCSISDGTIDLLNFSLFAPSLEQAEIIKKNFYEKPSAIYKTMLALVTKDKETVGEALEDVLL